MWGIAEKEGYIVAGPTLTSVVRGFSSGPKLRCLPLPSKSLAHPLGVSLNKYICSMLGLT